MTPQKELSACCKAPVTIEHGCDSDAGHLGACTCSGDGITMFYMCSKCNNACDIYVNLDLKKMKKESDKDKKAYHDNPKAFPKLELTPEQVATSKSVPEWEKEFNERFIESKYAERIKDFIRTLLQKKEAEYKEALYFKWEAGLEERLEEEFNKIQKLKQQHKEELEKIKAEHEKELESLVKENADVGERFLILSLTSSKQLKELKQQHREELEGLVSEMTHNCGNPTCPYYDAVDKLKRIVDKLLNSQKEE